MAKLKPGLDTDSVDDEGSRVLFTLSLINKAISRHLEQRVKAELDPALSISHADILMYLHLRGRATASELRDFLGLTKSTVTALIAKLEGLGYISREADKLDGRVSWLQPAASFKRKLGRARMIGAQARQLILRDFSARDTAELLRLLRKLQLNIGELQKP